MVPPSLQGKSVPLSSAFTSFPELALSISPSSSLSPLAPDVFARLSDLQLLPYYLLLLLCLECSPSHPSPPGQLPDPPEIFSSV